MTVRLLILVFLFSAFSSALKAEETWYQIEYILFHHKPADLTTLAYEDRPQISKSKLAYRFYKGEMNRGDDLNQHKLSDYHIYATPEDAERTLDEAFTRLKRDPRTKVYHYRHWQQGFESDIDTLPVKIYEQLGPNQVLDGQILIEKERFLHAKIDVTLMDLFAVKKIDWVTQALQAVEPAYDFADEPWQPPGLANLLFPESFELAYPYENSPIYKTIQLYKDVDESVVSYELMPFSENYEWLGFNSIHFVDSRRIKDKELHYIDHPYFGMIATIKRIENPNVFDFENQDDSQTETQSAPGV